MSGLGFGSWGRVLGSGLIEFFGVALRVLCFGLRFFAVWA